jgi:hypothetical protein
LPFCTGAFRERWLMLVSDHRGAQDEESNMLQTEIHEYARKLLEVRGPGAIAEAAQKAITLDKEGKEDEAQNWRHIADAMKQMRGPHQS